MTKEVIIDGVHYVPANSIKLTNEKNMQAVLEVLTEMRYFNQRHKMKALAWNALNELSPVLANMTEEQAYDLVHGEET